jgi:hypothetical protein
MEEIRYSFVYVLVKPTGFKKMEIWWMVNDIISVSIVMKHIKLETLPNQIIQAFGYQVYRFQWVTTENKYVVNVFFTKNRLQLW